MIALLRNYAVSWGDLKDEFGEIIGPDFIEWPGFDTLEEAIACCRRCVEQYVGWIVKHWQGEPTEEDIFERWLHTADKPIIWSALPDVSFDDTQYAREVIPRLMQARWPRPAGGA
ncbi:MAG: hypothetical protein ACRD9R_10345 [Pyrinomonadaceae bacterium]